MSESALTASFELHRPALTGHCYRMLGSVVDAEEAMLRAWKSVGQFREQSSLKTEAFRRAVLRLFVRLELFDEEQAAGMLTWPHSGFHVHTAVWVPEDDRAFATRLARYCARNPVALERLNDD